MRIFIHLFFQYSMIVRRAPAWLFFHFWKKDIYDFFNKCNNLLFYNLISTNFNYIKIFYIIFPKINHIKFLLLNLNTFLKKLINIYSFYVRTEEWMRLLVAVYHDLIITSFMYAIKKVYVCNIIYKSWLSFWLGGWG